MRTGLSTVPVPALSYVQSESVHATYAAAARSSEASQMERSVHVTATSSSASVSGLQVPDETLMRLVWRLPGAFLARPVPTLEAPQEVSETLPTDKPRSQVREVLLHLDVQSVRFGHPWPPGVRAWADLAEADLQITMGGEHGIRYIAARREPLLSASKTLRKDTSDGKIWLKVPKISLEVAERSLAALYKLSGREIAYERLSLTDLFDVMEWVEFLSETTNPSGRVLCKQFRDSRRHMLGRCHEQFGEILELLTARNARITIDHVVEWGSCHIDIVEKSIPHLSAQAFAALLQSDALVVDADTWNKWRAMRTDVENIAKPNSGLWSVEADFNRAWRVLSRGGKNHRDYFMEIPESVKDGRHVVFPLVYWFDSKWEFAIDHENFDLKCTDLGGSVFTTHVELSSFAAPDVPMQRASSTRTAVRYLLFPWTNAADAPAASPAWCQEGKLRFRLSVRAR